MTHAPLRNGQLQPNAPIAKHRTRAGMGLTQMSLVEHALCPLDAAASLRRGMVFEPSYFFTDKHRNRREATVAVACPDGLAAGDELYLWGLLAITFAQEEPLLDFSATPHYCLRQLGLIASGADKGGRNYQLFRAAIARLAKVTYQNTAFYDPLRGEHRDVAFGFLSYSLPLDAGSSRAWRFVWNPLFFEFCQASGGALSFDLATYRELDGASRRLYLLLKKIFWRSESSPAFDLRHLAVNVLGFSGALPTWKLKQKVVHAIESLLDADILALPPHARDSAELFSKHGAGEYRVQFLRGANFDRGLSPSATALADSPHYDPLRTIGFDETAIARILRTYRPRTIAEWCDITLAAKERNGGKFFTSSPQAYFLDNVKHATQGERTPPDWWRLLRKQEDAQRRRDASTVRTTNAARAFDEYLATEGRAAFEQLMGRIATEIRHAGQPEQEARDRAATIARMNLRAAFRRQYPQYRDDEPSPASEALSL